MNPNFVRYSNTPGKAVSGLRRGIIPKRVYVRARAVRDEKGEIKASPRGLMSIPS